MCALLGAAVETPHLKLFIILAIATGGRTTALLELTWDRVNFAEGWIDLGTPGEIGADDITHKGYQKGRAKVAMNDMSRAALADMYDWRMSDHVIEWAGRPIRSVKKSFARAAKSAGLEGVTPHTIATWCAEDGIEMQEIARLLGHKRATTTEAHYAKPDARASKKAASVLPERLKVVGE